MMILSCAKWLRRKLVFRGWIDHIKTILMWFGGITIVYLVITQNIRDSNTMQTYNDMPVDNAMIREVAEENSVGAHSGGVEDIHYEGKNVSDI